MKLSDIKAGMDLKAVGDWGESKRRCFVTGKTYHVEGNGSLVWVKCGHGGDHILNGMEDDNGEIPELEPA